MVKAVLLNSARKTEGWTNNTVNANGVLKTTQGLDYSVGAGALDLNRAYDQYLSGTADVPGLGGGSVADIGWDYGRASKGSPNDYLIGRSLLQGEVFTATLDWFVNRSFDPLTKSAADVAFNELDLEVWKVINGQLSSLVADSMAPYNNVQHLFFAIPSDGYYALRVNWAGSIYDVPGNSLTSDDYGLAWSVPEPGGIAVGLVSGMMILLQRRGPRKNHGAG